MEESASQFQLHVLQGRTKFPERPLIDDRFLIGGGSQCQLQLGGDIPLIHSILTRHAEGWQIEAVTPWPLLMVNHQQVRRLVLRPDDLLEIGEFRFRLERHAAEVAMPIPEPVAEPVPIADAVAPDPAALAATELVQRLETAIDELEHRESRRRAGWNNLLSAAFAANAPKSEAASIVEPPLQAPVAAQPAPWAHLEAALAELTVQMKSLDARESALIDNAHLLEEQQAELLACLEAIRSELTEQASGEPSPHLKISA